MQQRIKYYVVHNRDIITIENNSDDTNTIKLD